MNREEACELGRNMYTTYGTMTQIDTIKIGPEGGIIAGVPLREADGWAVYAHATWRVLWPAEYRGKKAYHRKQDSALTHAICRRCDGAGFELEKHKKLSCDCISPCGHEICQAKPFKPPEDDWT